MSANKQKQCMGCMAYLDREAPECRDCEYRKSDDRNPDCLPPGAKIGSYKIGAVISQNGESAFYMGLNTEDGTKVLIKEFLPLKLAWRNRETLQLTVQPGCETKYKYFKASFEDINKTMKEMACVPCLIPTLDLVEEHNTIYVVYQYIDITPLTAYLEKIGGDELWCKAKKYLLPLYNGLSNLHKKGITHQGICPDNVYLDKEQRPYLVGFSISEVRTDKGELETELFPGYSAPEQYSLESWQGTWTDVYSMAALTYRILTGAEPQPAPERQKRDELVAATELDFTIPENISQAIARGMEIEVAKRFQNVDEFTGKLLETVGSNTAVFQVEEELQTRESPGINTVRVNTNGINPEPQSKLTNRYTVVTMVATLLVLVVFGSTIYNQFAPPPGASQVVVEPISEEVLPKPPATASPAATAESKVPNWVGKAGESVTTAPEYAEKYLFEVVGVYSEIFPAGIVMEQNPKAGTSMTKKGTVTLTVSKGSEMASLPNCYDMTKDEAISAISALGLEPRVYELESDNVDVGYVFRTEPAAYTQIKKWSGEVVIIYVAKEAAPEDVVPPEDTGKKIIRPTRPHENGADGDV